MLPFKKAIINLDGHSSKILDIQEIKINIVAVLKMLGLPYEIYKPHKKGFRVLQEEMNRPDTLYILNDSLQYHLCEKPCILITRSIPWVQSAPKPNTIGVITQEMMLTNRSFLMALIYRNQPVRGFYNKYAARTYLVANDYFSSNMDVMHRNSMAMITWNHVSKKDIHFSSSFHVSDGLPFVNDILKEGLSLLSHPDDLLIITNRDICLVNESTAIIRAYMDSLNLSCCYAKRVDLPEIPFPLSFSQIQSHPQAPGIDLFVFRKEALCIPELIETKLYLGRVGWDSFWADRVQYELPFKICYHQMHGSDWTTEKGEKENAHNICIISQALVDFQVSCNEKGPYYTKNI
jgi:hypothetical protein